MIFLGALLYGWTFNEIRKREEARNRPAPVITYYAPDRLDDPVDPEAEERWVRYAAEVQQKRAAAAGITGKDIDWRWRA